MTVFLPRNYDPKRQHPLLIFLNGGTGGNGANPAVARRLTEERDFVCVDFPLFKAPDPQAPAGAKPAMKMTDEDYRLMWPLYQQMLARLDRAVPNIDPAHRVLGGFSNGGHTTAGLIEQSNGEVPKQFCAFLFVEGGGRIQRFDLIQGKPLLIVYGDKSTRQTRIDEIRGVAEAAGVHVKTQAMINTGHAFAETAYPEVRSWLYESALR
jgi:dienelactone hydrolase